MHMARGVLRVYLGAAPSVGKTVDMLEEGKLQQHRRRAGPGAGPRPDRGYARRAHPQDTPGGGLTMVISLPAVTEAEHPAPAVVFR
jgi:hypothetical protein